MSFSRTLVAAVVSSGLLASTPAEVQAGPDETTSRLINENASLMDFGILRLQIFLDGIPFLSRSDVTYDWDQNVILISEYSIEPNWDRAKVETTCDEWFPIVRLNAAVDPETGELISGFETSKFSDFFLHSGYDKTVAERGTSEVVRELGQKFRLTYTWFNANGKPGEVAKIECSGPLLDKGYSIKVEQVEG